MASQSAGASPVHPRPATWSRVALALAVPILALCSGNARAQFTGDPFDPYRNNYRSSSVPTYSNIGPLSNSFRYAPSTGVGFTTGLGDVGPEIPFLSGLNTSLSMPRGANLSPTDPFGLPSTLVNPANRGQTQGFDRSYRPNANVDDKYYEQVRTRDQLYFKALEESDPAKRAELLKQFRQASTRANFQLSATSRPRRGTEIIRAAPAGRSAAPRRPDAPPDPTRPVGTPTDNPDVVTTYAGMLSWSRVLDRMVVQDMKGAKP